MRVPGWGLVGRLSNIVVLLFLTGGCGKSIPNLNINTEYTSIFLDNGQVFVGRLEKAEPSYILLKDVFYVKSWVIQDNDQNKEIRNTISARRNEPHSPSFTYISTAHILVIEPVSNNSKVSELIKKSKTESGQASP
jgi:hypothetical protein